MFRGVPFTVSDMEVEELCRCLGEVGDKGIWYNKGDEDLVNMDRYVDIELRKGVQIPPKLMLGGKQIRVSYPGQLPGCGNCLKPKKICDFQGLESRCRENRPRANLLTMCRQFYRSIGFCGEPGLVGGDDEVDTVAMKEQTKATEGNG